MTCVLTCALHALVAYSLSTLLCCLSPLPPSLTSAPVSARRRTCPASWPAACRWTRWTRRGAPPSSAQPPTATSGSCSSSSPTARCVSGQLGVAAVCCAWLGLLAAGPDDSCLCCAHLPPECKAREQRRQHRAALGVPERPRRCGSPPAGSRRQRQRAECCAANPRRRGAAERRDRRAAAHLRRDWRGRRVRPRSGWGGGGGRRGGGNQR